MKSAVIAAAPAPAHNAVHRAKSKRVAVFRNIGGKAAASACGREL